MSDEFQVSWSDSDAVLGRSPERAMVRMALGIAILALAGMQNAAHMEAKSSGHWPRWDGRAIASHAFKVMGGRFATGSMGMRITVIVDAVMDRVASMFPVDESHG